jgi:hypothetical protein
MKNAADKFNVNNVTNLKWREKRKQKRGAELTPRLRSTVKILSPLV